MIARSGEVAAAILNRRDPLRLKLGDETFTRIMLAEAYSQGLRDGLQDALAAVEAELAKVVRLGQPVLAREGRSHE